MTESLTLNRSGPDQSSSSAALAPSTRRGDAPLAPAIISATAVKPLTDPEPAEIERIISAVDQKLFAQHTFAQQEHQITLFQHQVEYSQSMSTGRLDVAAAKPNIAGTVVQAETLGKPGGLGNVEPDGVKPNLAEGRDRMAEKSEQGHFVQEMVKRLAPQFDALKMQSETVAASLSVVKTTLDAHSHDLSDIARRMDDQYRLTIAHTQALESEIGSLRREMNDNSAKTNALLQAIASSLQGRSASAE
jgi:hypothetical protein